MSKYKRNPEELKKKATLYWPEELTMKEKGTSIIPKLINSQDKFISVLDVSDSTPTSWKNVLKATQELPANLFLKHLMILSDMGGENLQRINANFKKTFKKGTLIFFWRGKSYRYKFKVIPVRSLTNSALAVDGGGLQKSKKLEPVIEDTIMLLLHGSTSIGGSIPDIIKDRCIIGSMMGEKQKLERFVKQRYIWVSRITGGATSNTMGQIAQDYVLELLKNNLPNWRFNRNGSIPGMSQNAGLTDISFDIVAISPFEKRIAIEVSFQFTTNSVIERKSGQAEVRAKLLHAAGHKIAYVLDGAGNFERNSAISNICKNSDCTVAFSPTDIQVLVEFLRENQ